MIHKTVKQFRRSVLTWGRGYVSDEKHTERILRETWWLFGIVPIYSRDRIIADSLV